MSKPKATYVRNRVMFSTLSNRVFFCPRLRVLENGVYKVVGKKYDVTEDLQPYLLKKHRSGEVIIRGGRKAKS